MANQMVVYVKQAAKDGFKGQELMKEAARRYHGSRTKKVKGKKTKSTKRKKTKSHPRKPFKK
jgi:hypothetical protein